MEAAKHLMLQISSIAFNHNCSFFSHSTSSLILDVVPHCFDTLRLGSATLSNIRSPDRYFFLPPHTGSGKWKNADAAE